MNGELEVLCGVIVAVELLGNSPGMVEDLCALNADCHGLLHSGIGFDILRVDIEGPGVGIERPNVLPRLNLGLGKLERIGGSGRILGKHQYQVAHGLIRDAVGIAGELLKLLKRGVGFLHLSRSLLCGGQLVEDVWVVVEDGGLLEELNCVGGPALSHANAGEIFEGIGIMGKDFSSLLKDMRGGLSLPRIDEDCRDLVCDKGLLLHFSGRCLCGGAVEEVDGAAVIAKQDAQLCSDEQSRSVVGAQIHHPLRVGFRCGVISQADGRFGEIAKGHHVVGYAVMQGGCQISCLSESVPAQQKRNLSPLKLKIRRIQFESLCECLIRLIQPGGIGSFASSAKEADGQLVIGLDLLRIGLELLLGGSNALLSGGVLRGCGRVQSRARLRGRGGLKPQGSEEQQAEDDEEFLLGFHDAPSAESS